MNKEELLMLELNKIIEDNNLSENVIKGILEKRLKYLKVVDRPIGKRIRQIIQLLSNGQKY